LTQSGETGKAVQSRHCPRNCKRRCRSNLVTAPDGVGRPERSDQCIEGRRRESGNL